MPYRFFKLSASGEKIMDTVTNWIAYSGIAVGSATWMWPFLYEWVVQASHGAALFMPILGCMWLGVQIWSRLYRGK